MSRVGGFKKMNWATKPTAWQQAEAVRKRRRKHIQNFQHQQNAFIGALGSAQSHQIRSVGQVAAYSAQARMQAKLDEMRAELTKKYEQFSKLV